MKFQIYKDKKGEYRWRLRARNGRILADSAEGYKRKGAAKKAAAAIYEAIRYEWGYCRCEEV